MFERRVIMHSTCENTKINHNRMCQHIAQSITHVFPIFFDRTGLLLGATMPYQNTHLLFIEKDNGVLDCDWGGVEGKGKRVEGHPKGASMLFHQYIYYGLPILIMIFWQGWRMLDWDWGGIGKMGVGKGVGTPEGYFHEISSIYLLRFARFEFLNFSE